MSARRNARRRTEYAVDSAGGVPKSLLLGRCYEVWATDADLRGHDSDWLARVVRTRRRFSEAREWWLSSNGITTKDGYGLLPAGQVWSIGHLLQTERADQVTSRLACVSCDLADLPALLRDAETLLALVPRESKTGRIAS